MGDLLPAQGMRSRDLPLDGVDGCPHQQQDSVRWAPGQLSQAVTPVRHRVMDEQPDKGGSQKGQDHEDGPLRPHSPGGGAIWGGREHADDSLPRICLPVSSYLTLFPGLSLS